MATPQRLETVRRLQLAMATSYSAMGAWCLVHPSSVMALGFTPAYAALCNTTTALLMRCFGAQAMTCGLVLGTSTMTPLSFTAFGLAMIPYVGWNFWFSAVGPAAGVISGLMWMDFAGNLFFGLGSLYCARLLREQQQEDGARLQGAKEKGL
ncbi:hypothetical protein B0T26DRAFT_695230 [Lasiosphaeria miniovina]|uniref:Uncharacterized protein n=1 Tax=Lasiosphaeria miniovina TaxID=1954250 RepID=A0AA40B4Q3_9PEZI|nr:uncharacterized protein B0T26DRAFT_695230 [Lasiosphaeria miniovina]KAK0727635.1 hypothetical protein B0T26DRAFT_695230 [Lasiosphaeria miniovina]